MKSTKFFIPAILALGLSSAAHAQTVINITGATAFRQAAHQAIIDSFDAGSLTYGYQGTNVGNAGRAIFKGTINSGADSIIVRTSWSGAVAGVRAIVNQADAVTYLATTANATSSGEQNVNSPTSTVNGPNGNSIAFSDNTQDNTPFDAVSLLGGPVGVVAFVAVTNNSTLLNQGDNITTLQLRRLAEQGSAPLQFVTGNASDAGKKLYWTGRQDTSGTRTIYLSELGIGASNAVNQWRVEPLNNTTGINITAIQLWPTGDTTNRSTIWGPDTAGNGGYASGGALAPVLQRTSNGVTIKDATGGTISSNQTIALVNVISAQEGQDIQNGGGKVLAYNGSYIEPEALPLGLSAADRDKIIKGQYTFWSYEQLYYRDDISDQPTLDFIALLETNVPLNIGGNGIPVSDMRVSRAQDGGKLSVLGTLP